MVRLLLLVWFVAGVSYAQAQSYQPGYFISLDRMEVRGSIKFNSIQCGHLSPGGGSVPGKIKIKPENDSDVYEMTADEIRGFVMGLDSFIVIKNIPVSERDHFRRDFVKVEAVGRLNLYVHCSQIPTGRFGTTTKKVYILSRRGTKKMVAFHNRYQKAQFIQLISDDPELSKEVESDWQWMDRIPQTIKTYNSKWVELNAKKHS